MNARFLVYMEVRGTSCSLCSLVAESRYVSALYAAYDSLCLMRVSILLADDVADDVELCSMHV